MFSLVFFALLDSLGLFPSFQILSDPFRSSQLDFKASSFWRCQFHSALELAALGVSRASAAGARPLSFLDLMTYLTYLRFGQTLFHQALSLCCFKLLLADDCKFWCSESWYAAAVFSVLSAFVELKSTADFNVQILQLITGPWVVSICDAWAAERMVSKIGWIAWQWGPSIVIWTNCSNSTLLVVRVVFTSKSSKFCVTLDAYFNRPTYLSMSLFCSSGRCWRRCCKARSACAFCLVAEFTRLGLEDEAHMQKRPRTVTSVEISVSRNQSNMSSICSFFLTILAHWKSCTCLTASSFFFIIHDFGRSTSWFWGPVIFQFELLPRCKTPLVD